MADELAEMINAKLDGHAHAVWCGTNVGRFNSACDCRPAASREELAQAIRDVIDLCDDDDPPPVAAFMAESIRLAVALRLGIVDGNGANRRLLAVAKRVGLQVPGEAPHVQ